MTNVKKIAWPLFKAELAQLIRSYGIKVKHVTDADIAERVAAYLARSDHDRDNEEATE